MDVLSRNHVRLYGDGPRTLVLAHGFGCDQTMWRYVVPHLASDYRLILFDYVGSGQSDLEAYTSERYDTLQGYATDVLEVCEAAADTPVDFVGHSVSAMIGVLASLRAPERFRTLTHLCPSPCFQNDPPDYYGGFSREDLEELIALVRQNEPAWVQALAPAVAMNPERPEVQAELEERFCELAPEVAYDFARATFLADYRAELAAVPVSSLVLYSRTDAIVPPGVIDFMREHLPRATFLELDASGHLPHLSDPEQTAEALRAFFDAHASVHRLSGPSAS